jgi:hypothetical protein
MIVSYISDLIIPSMWEYYVPLVGMEIISDCACECYTSCIAECIDEATGVFRILRDEQVSHSRLRMVRLITWACVMFG